MKRVLNVLPGLIAGILGALLLAGCSNQFSPAPDASGQGRVTIRIENGEQARTLFPEAPVFSRYELQFTPGSGQEAKEAEDVTDPNSHSVTLATGDWTITAIAYIEISGITGITDGEYEAARGNNTLTVGEGPDNSVGIDIHGDIGDGEGIFSYELSYPQDVDAAAFSILTLAGEPLDPPIAVDLLMEKAPVPPVPFGWTPVTIFSGWNWKRGWESSPRLR
jgi:hypothetical protein